MDDYKFKTMLDSALVQMLYGGRVDKIIKKYEEVPGGIYRVAKPYEAVQ
jgi:ABC-type amino acid transport substrate-binding protein